MLFAHSPVPHSPVAHSPVTHSPVAHFTVTHSPVSYSPVTYSPVTHSPVTHSPVTHSPVTHSPVTHSPVIHSPVIHSPLTHSPVAIGRIVAPRAGLFSGPQYNLDRSCRYCCHCPRSRPLYLLRYSSGKKQWVLEDHCHSLFPLGKSSRLQYKPTFGKEAVGPVATVATAHGAVHYTTYASRIATF